MLVHFLVASFGGNISIPDNGKFVAGVGDDHKIYHDGTHSYITNATNDLNNCQCVRISTHFKIK